MAAPSLDTWSEAFGLAAERCATDHPPVADWEPSSDLRSLFESLPLYPALSLPEKELRKRVRVRGAKDQRMKAVIRELTADSGPATIVNHCCVFSRHARDLARTLGNVSVIAADVDSTWHWLYSLYERLLFRRRPSNYRFVRENVYASALECAAPTVCVFGGCGSLVDASVDLGVRLGAPNIVVRACCHENIGMNMRISTRALTIWNLGHRLKNIAYRFYHRLLGYYGDSRYGSTAYPRSRTAQAWLATDDMVKHARHSVDCWLCRTLIDLDRILFLVESGYTVLGYSESMFVATLQA